MPDEQTVLSHDRFHASVKTGQDKKHAQIYKQTVDEEKRLTTCYIEAKEGETFVVRAWDSVKEEREWDWMWKLYLDGGWVAGLVGRRDRINRYQPGAEGRMMYFDGTFDSDRTERPFLFAKPNLTEDGDVNITEEVMKNLSTIKLTIHRGLRGEETPMPGQRIAGERILSERSKKVTLSHVAKFGEVKEIAPRRFAKFNYEDPIEKPYWTLEFRYQSRMLLELLGHVEHPNAPPAPTKVEQGPNQNRSSKSKGKQRAEENAETIVINSSSDESDASSPGRKRKRRKRESTEDVKQEQRQTMTTKQKEARLAELYKRIAELEAHPAVQETDEKPDKKVKLEREKVTSREEERKCGKKVIIIEDD
ncbi:hypothetical protein T439DRAFT_321660 [Meredithblackwellia eburnea MCA 4105]